MYPTPETSWHVRLAPEFLKEYFLELVDTVQAAYTTDVVYPTEENIFAALNLCPLGKVKVVILGQDPYHGPDQAHGLAFSVPDDIAIPPSLQNIYKEIATDIGIPIPLSGNLTKWAEQGVLLLNSTLTVAAGKPLSHAKYGWEQFTDAVITLVSEKHDNVVFLLWGSFAVSKRPLIDEGKHLVLTAPHPSPLSAYRGFFGCRHFSQCNDYLLAHHKQPIRW